MIYIIHGNDIFRAKNHISLMIKNHQTTDPDISVRHFDCATLTSREFQNVLQPWQLFSRQSLIVIKNPLSQKPDLIEILINYLSNPSENIDLIIWEQSALDKRKTFYKQIKKLKLNQEEFNLPKKYQLNSWIKEYCRQEKINITPEAINLLSASHYNPYQIYQEITKLKIFSDNRIKAEDIKKISPPSTSSIIFDLTDQIGRKNPVAFATAKKLIYQGEAPPRILATLATHIANLIIIKESVKRRLNPKQIKEITKLHPYVIEKGTEQCRNFTLDDLIKIYHLIALADIELKTGQSDFDQSIYKIINFNLFSSKKTGIS